MIFLLIVLPLLSYGTLSPCGVLRKELKYKLLEKVQASESGWEALGSALGMGLGSTMVDAMVDAMSPMQCVRGFVRVKFGGANILGETSLPQQRKTEIHEILKGWRVGTEKSPMDDSTNVYVSLYADQSC